MFNNNKIKRNWRSSDVKKFLTFTANTAGSTVKLTSFHEDSVFYNNSTRTVPAECKCPYLLSLEYSTNGINWQAYNFSEVYDENDNLIGYDGQVITLPRVGDFLIIRATSSNANLNPNGGWCNWLTNVDTQYVSPTGWYQFVLSGSVAASGNIQSLVGKKLPTGGVLGGYFRLFKNCTQLTSAPSLEGVKSIKNHAFHEMFYGCTNIEYVKFADKIENNGGAAYDFVSMFEGCSSLIEVSDINTYQAATWGVYARDNFSRMFFGCSSLVKVPLYTTDRGEVASSAYIRMFEGCTSIEDASEYRMYSPHEAVSHSGERTFYGCTSLKYPPYLNNSILNVSWGNGNEGLKFAGCSSLKEIIYAEDSWLNGEKQDNKLFNWVDGVSANGTFFCKHGFPIVRGKNAIPHGWNINEIDDRPLCFESETAGGAIALLKSGTPPHEDDNVFQYSTDGTNWNKVVFGEYVELPNIGDKVYFRNLCRTPHEALNYISSTGWYRFNSRSPYPRSKFKCTGNIFSMLRYEGVYAGKPFNTGATSEWYYMLYGIFAGMNGTITSFPTLPDGNFIYCPQSLGLLFMYNCKGLTEVTLQLKKAKLCWNAWYRLFLGGDNLHTCYIKLRDQNFDAYNGASGSLRELFKNCTSLTKVGVYFTRWKFPSRASNVTTYEWMVNVSSSGTFICPKGLEIIRDDSHIPQNWEVKRWYQYMGEQYLSVAQMMSDYPALEDVVDTYPDVAPILDQYPNLVHSLVSTGYKPYMLVDCDRWYTDIYPHQYMSAEFAYNKEYANDDFNLFSNAASSQGFFSIEHNYAHNGVKIQFGDGYVNNYGSLCTDVGIHVITLSKDGVIYDGVATSGNNIRIGSFDSASKGNYRIPSSIYFGGSKHCSSKFYYIKIFEYDVLTHHFVPIADRVFADIADLDNIKILDATLDSSDPEYASDTSVFGLEQI